MTDDPKQNLEEGVGANPDVGNGEEQETGEQHFMNRRRLIRGAATMIGAGFVAATAGRVLGAEGTDKKAKEVRSRILAQIQNSMQAPMDDGGGTFGYDKSDGGHSRYVKA